MSNEKFTKGEWDLWNSGITGPTTPTHEPFCDNKIKYTVVRKDKQTICVIPAPEFDNQIEMNANAALISAAPEMYEVIKDYFETTRCVADDWKEFELKAEAALAKANPQTDSI